MKKSNLEPESEKFVVAPLICVNARFKAGWNWNLCKRNNWTHYTEAQYIESQLNTNNGTIFVQLEMTISRQYNWTHFIICIVMLFNRSDNILPEFRHIVNHSMTNVQIHLIKNLYCAEMFFLLVVKFHQLNI